MKNEFNPFTKFDKDWALVTSGTKEKFNSMTISWGSMGTIWRKSVITIYVRPERFTHSFLMDNDYFTVSFYDESYKEALSIMGTKSGKDTDKVKLAKLTPNFIKEDIISFLEAKETYICKKIYVQDLIKENIPEDSKFFYGENGFPHTLIIGEVIEKI